MDIGKCFTFLFEDPEWLKKAGIGTALTLAGMVLSVIIIGVVPLIIVTGYSLVVLRNVIDRQQYPLPEWQAWGDYLGRGFKLCVVFFVWMLPAFVAYIPVIALAASTGGSRNSSPNGVLSAVSVCCSCFIFLYALAVTVMSPALYVQVAKTNSIAAGFNFSFLIAYTRANLGNVIVAVLMSLVIGMVAAIGGMLGVIAIGIGLLVSVPFAVFWQMIAQSFLFAQVELNDKSAGPTILPPEPSELSSGL
jgi:hypothetical protein